jgi:hypothetical protein
MESKGNERTPFKPWFILIVSAVVIINMVEWGRIYKIGLLGFIFIGLVGLGLVTMAVYKK